MGTSSMIGIYNSEDGTVQASYCHYDGYVDGNGATLLSAYNSQYDAEIVANGGYLSGLTNDYLESRINSVHDDKASRYSSIEQYLNMGGNINGAEYLYLWDGVCWMVASLYEKAVKFVKVEMILTKA
tara:strand:- start:68 stop:448 length:381 start_codon:yes stop_codon:yes gene_type:complete